MESLRRLPLLSLSCELPAAGLCNQLRSLVLKLELLNSSGLDAEAISMLDKIVEHSDKHSEASDSVLPVLLRRE